MVVLFRCPLMPEIMHRRASKVWKAGKSLYDLNTVSVTWDPEELTIFH